MGTVPLVLLFFVWVVGLFVRGGREMGAMGDGHGCVRGWRCVRLEVKGRAFGRLVLLCSFRTL